jgi:small subunit ribosomal protein S4
MGRPKFSRKKYETPSHPWQEDRIKEENELIKKFGLKNKKEIWKAETLLRKYRGHARELLAKVGTGDSQSKKESDQLLMYLSRLNILPPNSTLDDVLALDPESILSRRLQTLTYLKGLASTPTQSRQLISHGHIAISGRRVNVPGYMVTKDEEGEIGFTSDSPLNDIMHPARPRADFKSVPVIKEPKEPEKKEEPAEEKVEEKPSEVAPIEEKPTVTPTEPPKEEEQPTATPKPEEVKEVSSEKPKEKPAEKPLVELKPEESAPPEDKKPEEKTPMPKPKEEKKEEAKKKGKSKKEGGGK